MLDVIREGGGGVGCLIYWPESGRLSGGRCLLECGLLFEEIRYMQFRAMKGKRRKGRFFLTRLVTYYLLITN